MNEWCILHKRHLSVIVYSDEWLKMPTQLALFWTNENIDWSKNVDKAEIMLPQPLYKHAFHSLLTTVMFQASENSWNDLSAGHTEVENTTLRLSYVCEHFIKCFYTKKNAICFEDKLSGVCSVVDTI